MLRISTSFIEESKENCSFLWQIISCSLRGLLIIVVHNFQRFSDRSFVSAFELIFILKLDWTVKCNFQNTKKNTKAINISLQTAQQRHTCPRIE